VTSQRRGLSESDTTHENIELLALLPGRPPESTPTSPGRVPDEVITRALAKGALTARVKLQDELGWPVCAALDAKQL
jgi:hypothetical protein